MSDAFCNGKVENAVIPSDLKLITTKCVLTQNTEWIMQLKNLDRYYVAASWLPVRERVSSEVVFLKYIEGNSAMAGFVENLDRFRLTSVIAPWSPIGYDIIGQAI